MPAHDKGVDLAIVFGAGKGGRKKPPALSATEMSESELMGEERAHESEGEEFDPAFESAAIEYDPSLEGDTARLGALKRLIMACTESY